MSKTRSFILLLIFCFGFLTILAKSIPYFKLDLSISQAIQQFNPVWFDFLMRFLSALGNDFWPIILTLFIGLIYAGLGKKINMLLIGFSTLGSGVLAYMFKILVDRPRPDDELIFHLTKPLESASFPSGHVLFAIGLFGFLFFLIYEEMKESWVKNFLLVVLLSAIILMGVSRIYLGMHWFSDVLGSYLVGTIWIYFMIYLYKRFKLS